MMKKLRALCRRILAWVGRGLGSLTIFFWSRPKRCEFPVPVHMLVSAVSWHCGLLAAISLEYHSQKNWRFVIHDDGTVTKSQRRIILKALSGSRFISREEAEDKMAKELQAYPHCREHRSKHNFFLKFFDSLAFVEHPKFFLLDSDVLFFKRPEEIIKWVEADSAEVFYNKDSQEKYSSPRSEIEAVYKVNLFEKFNSGLVLMQTEAMKLDLAESFLGVFEKTAHHPQFFEQTLYCLMSSVWGRGGGLPQNYEISWGYLRQRKSVCRHYVGAFKHDLLYIEGATSLFLKLLPNMLGNSIKSVFRKFWFVVGIVALTATLAFMGGAFCFQADLNKVISKMFGEPFSSLEVRSGLPRFVEKLEKESCILVGFIGGSITQNAENGGFISVLKDHLSKKFPNIAVRTLNAGMASTDSAWGAKRIERDLLEKKPDLVFVEFAVNDGNRASSEDMERLVRKIHAGDPATNIVFLYTTSDSAFRKLLAGKIPHAIQEHEKVAAHYGIPSIILGTDLAKRVATGEWKWENFSSDSCHPTPDGYNSYSRDLLSAFNKLLVAKSRISAEFPAPLAAKFEISPPKREVEPFSAGENSNTSEHMPIWGREWIDSPAFKSCSGSSWKLFYSIFKSMPDKGDLSEVHRSWLPANWFEEAGGFTGERSRIIADSSAPSPQSSLFIAPYLLGGSVEVPQIEWVPSQGGDYLINLSVQKIEGCLNGPLAVAGFCLFVRQSNEKLHKAASIDGGDGHSLTLRQPLYFQNGNSLLIRPYAKGYEFVGFRGLNVTIDRIGKPPVP
jgi:lysophospholipase L1-like esterase